MPSAGEIERQQVVAGLYGVEMGDCDPKTVRGVDRRWLSHGLA